MGSRLAIGVLGVFWLAGCASQRPAVEYQQEDWKFGASPGTKLTTAHYVIYTTLQEPTLLEKLPDFVEAAHANYRRLLPPSRSPAERMRIFLFLRRAEWEFFTRKLTDERAELFLKVRNGGYVTKGVAVIEYVAHQITYPLFAHEGWHQYLHHYVRPGIPAWLNEGLAVSCEGQRWGQERIQRFDPWFNPLRRNQLAEALQRDELHSLQTLIETHPGNVIQETSRSVSTYYAQVWALVLFLEHGADGRYQERFHHLLKSLAEVDPEQAARAAHIGSERELFNAGDALFRNYISEDLETVEQEYLAFMHERFLG